VDSGKSSARIYESCAEGRIELICFVAEHTINSGRPKPRRPSIENELQFLFLGSDPQLGVVLVVFVVLKLLLDALLPVKKLEVIRHLVFEHFFLSQSDWNGD
jgi:hypothetical protein